MPYDCRESEDYFGGGSQRPQPTPAERELIAAAKRAAALMDAESITHNSGLLLDGASDLHAAIAAWEATKA